MLLFCDEMRSSDTVESLMRFLGVLVLWCILFVLCWPVALAVLVLLPLIWLLSLPFMVAGVCLAAMLALLKSILFLPARLLGYRG